MGYTETHFDTNQLTILLAAGVCFGLSIVFHLRKQHRFSLVLMGLSALGLFCFSALLDPFLNLWDERFHALVAKNLLEHPLKPTLYDDPVVDMTYDHWDRFHVWLHKQPLFLWQIALSFKIFGVSEFSLRLPSAVMATAFVLATMRSGHLLVNARTGFLAGVLALSSPYLLQLVAGRATVEHNDAAFIAYVSLSIWSLLEYQRSGKQIWVIFIGIFCGCAILCKWLTGLLVFGVWGLIRLQKRQWQPLKNRDFLTAVGLAVLIAAPWQVISFLLYPEEAGAAMAYNSKHLTEAVEGHSGDFWFHLERIGLLYGGLAPIVIVPGFYLLWQRMKDRVVFWALTGAVCFVYLFFSVVATKMPSFPLVVAMPVFIALAAILHAGLDWVSRFIPSPAARISLLVAVVLFIALIRLDHDGLRKQHTLWQKGNTYTEMLSYNRDLLRSLELPKEAVLFNVRGRHYIEAMFYTGLPAYNFYPSPTNLKNLSEKGRPIALFWNPDDPLPPHLADRDDIILLHQELKGYE